MKECYVNAYKKDKIFDKDSVIGYIVKFHWHCLAIQAFNGKTPLSMQVTTSRTVPPLWLPLLMVLVLCTGITNPVYCVEGQQQEFELEAEAFAVSSEDEGLAGDYTPGRVVSGLQYISPCPDGKVSPLIGSDAYPGMILHGPPFPNYSV
jgi:hypothetical protein